MGGHTRRVPRFCFQPALISVAHAHVSFPQATQSVAHRLNAGPLGWRVSGGCGREADRTYIKEDITGVALLSAGHA